MKKFTLYWALIAALTVQTRTHAQIQDSVQLLYSELPDTLFPHGFLHDQSALRDLFHGTPYDLHQFDGSIPGKMVTKRLCELAYNDLFLSQRLSGGLLFGNKKPHLKSWSSFEQQSTEDSQSIDVRLYLNWFKVHELDSTAFDKGWLFYDGHRITTVPRKMWLDSAQTIPWNTPAPLDSALQAVNDFTVFFGGTNSPAHYITGQQTTLSFSLVDSLVQSNQQLPSVLYVDLDDGQGFRPTTLNQVLHATYATTSTHAELVHKDLAIRIRDAGKWLETRFQVPLIFNVSEPDTVLYTEHLASPPCYSTYSPKEEASITIKYANKGLGLQKPIVVVEGFESALKPYGVISYEGLASGIILNGNDERVFLGMEKLSWMYDSLHSSGYDIVHVDFKESKQRIEDNMQSLIRVLYWVNQQHADYPAIVVGASMGGLVARAALLELERSACFQNISAYGTFDTPHDGAFVPLGIQMGAKRIEELTTVFWHWSLVQTWSKALNSPTARQILIDHLDPTAVQDRAQLNALYRNEQPRTVRRFAVSNGSDMNVPSPLVDSVDVIAQWGKEKLVTYKHHVDPHLDSLTSNLNGGLKKPLIAYGASIEGMDSPSGFLYFGQRYLRNTLHFKRLWLRSKAGAYQSLLVKKLGAHAIINNLLADKIIKEIQRNTNTEFHKIHKTIEGNASKLAKQSSYHNYIEAPGSSTTSAKSFEQMFFSEVRSPSHTFIPSFSALNVGETFVNTPFRGDMELIPFHTYISPGLTLDKAGANQEHIYTDEHIINYALTTFEGVHRRIGHSGVLKSDYNIAKEFNAFSSYDSHIEQLEVAKGVSLSIGNPAGFVGQSTVPADNRQDIEVFVGNGSNGSELLIKGALRIGASQGSRSVLRINSGSRLVLSKNSTLSIGSESRLIIEPGAEVIVHPHATIEWDRGTIELQGVLKLVHGADFAPLGSGTLISEGTGRIAPQSSGNIALENSTWIIANLQHLTVNLTAVSLSDCDIEFRNKGELKVRSPFELLNSTVTYSGPKQWSGLSVSGTTALIKNSQFIGGAPSVLIASNASFSLHGCHFSNAKTGIYTTAAPDEFYGSSFTSCELGAYLSCDTTLIERNLFHGCTKGLEFRSSVKSTPLQMKYNVFTSNTLGSEVHDATLRLECNEWSYNTTGHRQHGGAVLMGNNAGNTYQSNGVGIKFTQLSQLKLHQGHNQWLGSSSLDMQGTFSSGNNLSHNGSYYYLSADNNLFTSNSSTDLKYGREKVYPMVGANSQPSSFLCPSKGPRKVAASSGRSKRHSLVVYPNPTTTALVMVEFDAIRLWGQIEIYTSQGLLIDAVELDKGQTTKSLHLPNTRGTYIVRLLTPNETETARVVLL